GYKSFLVSYSKLGKRTMRGFADLNDAKTFARQVCADIANGRHADLFLSGDARQEYLRAKEIIGDVKLDSVAREYAASISILAGRDSLEEACRDYMRRHATALKKISVPDAVQELIDSQKADGKSVARVKQLGNVLNRLAGNITFDVGSITPTIVSSYLSAMARSERTKRNHKDVIGFFSRWLVLRGYLPKGSDLLEGVQEYSARKLGEISTFSADEMAKLISAADERILPFFLLAGFAGLRHAEIARLDWADIDLVENFIEVSAQNAKTKVRRIVPIKENLKAWLMPLAKKNGKILIMKNTVKAVWQTAKLSGVEWRRNALRHTFISCRVAECADLPRVADEAGNSIAVI
ncbi:MAG: site-specific integrase, partial [Limisphaerales bacterium]